MKRVPHQNSTNKNKSFPIEFNLQNVLIASSILLALVRFAILPFVLTGSKTAQVQSAKSSAKIRGVVKDVLKMYSIRDNWQRPGEKSYEASIPSKFRFVDFYLSLSERLQSINAEISQTSEDQNDLRYTMVISQGSTIVDTLKLVRKSYLPNRSAQVAIIIDDFGYKFDKVAKEFIYFPQPITLSIIPHLKYSAEIIREGNMFEKELLIHMPMEPLEAAYDDDGMVLLTTQSAGEWRVRLQKAFSLITTARGLNNHQGSKATANTEMMRVVMDEIKKQNLFFIDSKTSPKSVAAKMARQAKVPTAENQVFIDAQNEPEFIKSQLERLADIAQQDGSAIGIGHVRKNTLEILTNKLPDFEARGIDIVSVSQLVQ